MSPFRQIGRAVARRRSSLTTSRQTISGTNTTAPVRIGRAVLSPTSRKMNSRVNRISRARQLRSCLSPRRAAGVASMDSSTRSGRSDPTALMDYL